MEVAQVSMNRWTNKEKLHTHTHTHTGILLSHKKEWNLVIYNDIHGATEYNAKWNKSGKTNTIWLYLYVLINKWAKGKKRGKEKNQETDS